MIVVFCALWYSFGKYIHMIHKKWWFTFSKEGRTITRQLEFVVTPHGHCYITFPDITVARKELYAEYLGFDFEGFQGVCARTSGEQFNDNMSWVRFQRVKDDMPILGAVVYEITP